MLLLDIKETVLYMLFLAALSILLGVLIVKHTKTAIKILLMVAVVVLSLAGIAYGEEEQPVVETRVEVINVEKVFIDNQTLWRAEFEYQGNILSWYENEEVFVGDEYDITLFGDEVVDAEYAPSITTMMFIFAPFFLCFGFFSIARRKS